MVTNAGSKLAANGHRSYTRVTSEATPHRLPDITNSGLPLQDRPGIVRLTRHAWERPQNFRSRREYPLQSARGGAQALAVGG
jgi:hypothetical protein